MGAGGTLGLQRACLIDTGTFIWIRDYYPLGIFPGLWDWLGKRCEEDVVTSIETVMDEVHDHGRAGGKIGGDAGRRISISGSCGCWREGSRLPGRAD